MKMANSHHILLLTLIVLPVLSYSLSLESPTDRRVLVLLDDFAYFNSLQSRGFKLDFKLADSASPIRAVLVMISGIKNPKNKKKDALKAKLTRASGLTRGPGRKTLNRRGLGMEIARRSTCFHAKVRRNAHSWFATQRFILLFSVKTQDLLRKSSDFQC
ncbi:dolichyl-diphosphooligosaccharide--protein glycosyltransferase 48 kDa subunit-like [Tripterygium wilfordii]|uniref:Dolichyl-diphosphooligosaccharide--protein glycosyltransferase 48 kDa subunit-like n=1 Tax=Tripterygium wilfordii TaxID=458696 RepID=A0A7J7DH71_TRIWF|nr:dolichyl-diphosphooligosaccharide--protein glycosyltransferase 48 kDa subunit-like [Tripterygium wilfordii]